MLGLMRATEQKKGRPIVFNWSYDCEIRAWPWLCRWAKWQKCNEILNEQLGKWSVSRGCVEDPPILDATQLWWNVMQKRKHCDEPFFDCLRWLRNIELNSFGNLQARPWRWGKGAGTQSLAKKAMMEVVVTGTTCNLFFCRTMCPDGRAKDEEREEGLHKGVL